MHMMSMAMHVFMTATGNSNQRRDEAEHDKQKEIRVLYLLIVAQNLWKNMHAGHVNEGTPRQEKGDWYPTVILGEYAAQS